MTQFKEEKVPHKKRNRRKLLDTPGPSHSHGWKSLSTQREHNGWGSSPLLNFYDILGTGNSAKKPRPQD